MFLRFTEKIANKIGSEIQNGHHKNNSNDSPKFSLTLVYHIFTQNRIQRGSAAEGRRPLWRGGRRPPPSLHEKSAKLGLGVFGATFFNIFDGLGVFLTIFLSFVP